MSPELPPRALHDPVLCLAPTLFRSLPRHRGERDRPLSLTYDHGKTRYVFEAPALLGCDDLRVLQGLVALGNSARKRITLGSSEGARLLRDDLHLAGIARNEEVLLVETSLASLAISAGYGAGRGGAMGAQLRSCLSRLASTCVAFRSPHGDGSWRILAWDECGTGRNRLRVAFNPDLGCCTVAGPRFVQIEMAEARRLQGDLARLLHQRLSGWIDLPGSSAVKAERRVRVSTLMTYAWGLFRDAGPSDAALRQRRASLRSALAELERVGWRIRPVGAGGDLLEIERPLSRAAQTLTA